MNEKEMKTFSIIAAVADNHAIGKDNKLLWHIPADLKRFRKLTTGHAVIMGKKTYESLPRRPLPDRINIVLTDQPDERIPGCITAFSVQDAIAKCPDDECFIIGGGSVYRQFLPLADTLYITRVHREFDADTFFPVLDNLEWHMVSSEEIPAGENQQFPYTYQIFKRKETNKRSIAKRTR